MLYSGPTILDFVGGEQSAVSYHSCKNAKFRLVCKVKKMLENGVFKGRSNLGFHSISYPPNDMHTKIILFRGLGLIFIYLPYSGRFPI